MEKDKFQPIVMPCTKEQYKSLIPVLKENKIETTIYDDAFKTITNNHNNCNSLVGKSVHSINDKWHVLMNRKIYKRFNRKIFLKSLGIIEEPEFVLPEKWCIKVTNENLEFCKNLKNCELHFQYQYTYVIGGFYGPERGDTGSYGTVDSGGRTEITFEQFKKYVLKQDDILESQSVTNKQTKMKSTVNEIKQSEPTIKKGLLVVTQERVGIVTKYISDNNFDVTILHPSGHHGLIVTNLNYANIRIFKGKLTLEQ